MNEREKGLGRNVLDYFQSPPGIVRAGEMVIGLGMAHLGDVPIAALGTAVFLHGLAGPEGYQLFQREGKERKSQK